MPSLLETHRPLLERALAATGRRGFWRAFPEAADDPAAEGAFAALLGRPFALEGAACTGRLGAERGAYGRALDVTYPAAPPETWIAAALAAAAPWAAAPVELRVGIALEALVRLEAEGALLARATMHTTGAPLALARAASGVQRGLEAVARSFEAMKRVPPSAVAEREVAGTAPARQWRRFRLVPEGLALVVGGPRTPTWYAYPGLFANLVAGNPVLVEPHPSAVLPLALTVRTLRTVLGEAGLPADVVQLCVGSPDAPVTKRLATHPAVRLIDHGGEPSVGDWLRRNATEARLRLQPSGVNPVVIDGTDDFDGLCAGLAGALALHVGQLPTRPQNLFVPTDGIATEQGPRSFEQVAEGVGAALDRLLADPVRAGRLCGALPDPALLDAARKAQPLGRIVREARPFSLPGYPGARSATPLLLAVEASHERVYARPQVGTVAFFVRTADTAESIERAAHGAQLQGAALAVVHSRNDHVVEAACDAFAAAFVPTACNFTGATDERAIADALGDDGVALDEAFVADRFRVIVERRPADDEPPTPA